MIAARVPLEHGVLPAGAGAEAQWRIPGQVYTPWLQPDAFANVPCTSKPTPTPMAHLFVALFLIVFGLNILIGLSLPMWLVGLLAVIAGVMLVMDHFRVRIDRK